MLEKKVKFNNQYWIVHLKDESAYMIDVFKCNSDGTIDRNFKYSGCHMDNNIINRCKQAILVANKQYNYLNEIELLASWDGDMDKSINGVLILEEN